MTLDPQTGRKPLDFGAAGLSGSVNQDGRIVALNAYHPEQGYVTLTSAPPFPESERYNPQAVRAYRRSLVDQEGFGLAFAEPVVARDAWMQDDLYPCVRLTFASGRQAECLTYPFEGHSVIQRWKFSDPQTQVRFAGRAWLQRSAYTQLTEGGPLPFPAPAAQIVQQDAASVTLYNPALPWAVSINCASAAPGDSGSVLFQGSRPAADGAFTLAIGSGRGPAQAQRALAAALDSAAPATPAALWAETPKDPLLRRGLAYTLACCAPTSGEALCILTDHMILPLSWNRDSYFAARALLSWKPALWPVVRAHLLWIFETAERINGLWGRSYLANGRVKDRGFQLDQQLFPIVELFEYVRVTADQGLLERLSGQIAPIMEALAQHRHPTEPLYRTDETPADDPVALPYPLSSHILLWYALRLLAEAGFPGDWAAQAESVREAIYRHFPAVYSGSAGRVTLLAYAADCAGRHHFYHDANDFPLVLAPVWGFCSVDDPLWRATVRFAFSEDNQAGFYNGHLGSVHTRAPWALGDLQEMVAARLSGDGARYAKAHAAVRAAAQWDGALSEAYDAVTGAVVSRHWFVWPNAVYACLLLGAFDNEL